MIKNNQPDSDFEKSYSIIICLFLIITTTSAYWQIHTFDFINFDDNEYVYENPHIKNGITADNIKWAFTSFYSGNWHPLTWISHMADCRFFGLNPGWHHILNLAFHIANTLLIFFVFKKMTGGLWQSAFVAALFALHPLHVESVAWISERKDVLSCFFFLAAIWAYSSYAHHPSTYRYLLMILLFVFGLLSKPMVVTLPFILILMDLWPLNRISLNHLSNMKNSRNWVVFYRLIMEKTPLLLFSAMSCIITFYAQQSGKSITNLALIPIHTRLISSLVSYLTYIEKMIYPSKLAVLYPYSFVQLPWKVLTAACLLAFISILSLMAIKKLPFLFVGWFWFLGMLIPVIGLVQIGYQSIADRYMYIPSIGLFAGITWTAETILEKFKMGNLWRALFAFSVIIILMVASREQIRYWKNSISLFEHTLNVTAGNYIIHNNLGLSLDKLGRTDEAIFHYLQAIRIMPMYVNPYYNLGLIFARRGENDKAIKYYSQAIQINPNLWEARWKLGDILYEQGRLSEAISHYSQAVKIQPNLEPVYNNLGNALYKQKRFDEAIKSYLTALQLNPSLAETHNNLGNALSQQNRLKEAVSHYEQAIKLKPDFAEAQNSLGVALTKTGDVAGAITCFKKALQINPDYISAKNNLSLLLEQQEKR